jgi:hypothetical protein
MYSVLSFDACGDIPVVVALVYGRKMRETLLMLKVMTQVLTIGH